MTCSFLPGGLAWISRPARVVLRLGQPQFGFAAAEQLGEELLEVAADLLESDEEALAALAVQALDALAQTADGGDQVVALKRSCR